jgi:hypothetical protein
MRRLSKQQINLILTSFSILVIIGKVFDKPILYLGAVPVFMYIGLYNLDVLLSMGNNRVKKVTGKIVNIKETRRGNRIKLPWKEFDLRLEDGNIRKYDVPDLEFPEDILENDEIEITYKQTPILSFVYVSNMKKLDGSSSMIRF